MNKKIAIALLCVAISAGGWFYHRWVHPVYDQITLETLVQDPKPHVVTTTVQAGESFENNTPYPMKATFEKNRIKASFQPGAKAKLLSLKQQKSQKNQMSLFSGNVKFIVKKSMISQNFEVRLPSSVAGVRGTKFSLEIHGRETKVKLPEGALVLISDSGKEVDLNAGEKAEILGEDISEIKIMTPEEIESELSDYEDEAFEPSLFHFYEKVVDSAYGRPFHVQQLPGGIHVGLRNNFRAKDLSPLESLPIVSLDISATGISDLKSLSYFPLVKLNLEENPIRDISTLSKLPLRELYLGGTEVSDLTPLLGKRLKVLTLWSTMVKDLSPLSKMPLEWLSFPNTKVLDIEALKDCMKLKALVMFQTPVKDISSLANLPLETLLLSLDPLEGDWRSVIESINTLKVLGESSMDLQLKKTVQQFMSEHKEQRRKTL